MTEFQLLTRDEFNRLVLARRAGRCSFCDLIAVDAHHIMERKLYPDGGYYLANGCAVCEQHHWECEITKITTEQCRAACGISEPVLPPGLDPDSKYDKWGNQIVSPDQRIPGPLAEDDGCRRALAAGHVIYQLYK